MTTDTKTRSKKYTPRQRSTLLAWMHAMKAMKDAQASLEELKRVAEETTPKDWTGDHSDRYAEFVTSTIPETVAGLLWVIRTSRNNLEQYASVPQQILAGVTNSDNSMPAEWVESHPGYWDALVEAERKALGIEADVAPLKVAVG